MYRHFTKSSPLSAYFTVRDRSLFIYSEIYSLFYGSGHTVTSSLTSSPVANVCRGGPQIIVAPLCWSARAYCRQKWPPRSGGHIVSPRSGQYLVVYDARRVVAGCRRKLPNVSFRANPRRCVSSQAMTAEAVSNHCHQVLVVRPSVRLSQGIRLSVGRNSS